MLSFYNTRYDSSSSHRKFVVFVLNFCFFFLRRHTHTNGRTQLHHHAHRQQFTVLNYKLEEHTDHIVEPFKEEEKYTTTDHIKHAVLHSVSRKNISHTDTLIRDTLIIYY